ncbi:hypothetical protein ACOKM3_07355 [Streptomyces sp. BH106]|uniref:hypothetical protein n=1 Tax=Streptomyces sp. BH106 TaxID=3410409 RepID=UPI003CF250A3
MRLAISNSHADQDRPPSRQLTPSVCDPGSVTKDIEILALRHQLAVLQRRLGNQRPGLQAADHAFLAALLAPLSRTVWGS